MNIREMQTAIPEKYPTAEVIVPPEQSKGFASFYVKLENGWYVCVGYGRSYRSGNSGKLFNDLQAVKRAEAWIMTPHQFLHSASKLDAEKFPGAEYGSWGWQTYDQICALIDEVSTYPPEAPKA